jgi:murein DD-endopeptidase MepM/ murein hydrolase activator NlpD/pyrimidine deaminase RibD-like protein
MNFHDLDNYNLADAVKFHQRLNPRLWGSDEHLLPDVRDKLLAIASNFQEFLGVDDLNIKDITISGSNAAYSYTRHSDIDLHLVVDMPDDPVYQELFNAKKYQYNAEHDIKIAGVPVELYVQPSDQKHVSQGIYSVKNGDWVQVPQQRRASIDDSCVQHKTADLDARIHSAIKSGNADAVNQLWDKIKTMRQTGLEKNGEFGCENITFKLLRNMGCIGQLKDAKTAIQDRELSLNRKPATRKKVNYGMRDYWYPGTAYAGQDHPAGTESEQVDESVELDHLKKILQRFYASCVDKLELENPPRLRLETTPDWSQENGSFGQYDSDTNTLILATAGRHVLDILRTMAHEMTHRQQDERNPLPIDAGKTGSPWEDQANAMAGRIMRQWAEEQPEMFDGVTLEEASGYIPTKAQARDPRFVMALTKDVRPGAVGKEANKLGLKTDSQGHPALLTAGLNKLLREFKEQDLFEINMGGKNLRKEAAKTGAIAGMEFEMIVPGIDSDQSNDEFEADYDFDERCRSIDDAVEFFHDGDFNGRREVARLRERMENDFQEWQTAKIDQDWDSDGEDFVRDWVANNVDNSEWLDNVNDQTTEQEAFEEFVSDVHSDPNNDYYQSALDEYREDNYGNYDESDWLNAEGLGLMSNVEDAYEIQWPHWSNPNEGNGSVDTQMVADEFSQAVGREVRVNTRYHQSGDRPGPKNQFYVVEPDGSLEGDNEGDEGLEFVSPPMPIDALLKDLNAVKAWAGRMGVYTNDSTGLHINISVPNYSIDQLDYVKLALLMGDEYVLENFGRATNEYAKSAMSKIKGKITPANAKQILDTMKSGMSQLATKAIHSGSTDKYTSINTKDGHIEFRSPGGDWLDDNFEKIENTLLRFTVAMSAALNPEAYRQEYLKKLYKLLAPKDDKDPLAIFAKYSAGELPKAALKSFVKQAQLERKVARDPTGGEKYWWRVGRPGYGGSVEVVATNPAEAIAAGKKEIPEWDYATDLTATPIRAYDKGPVLGRIGEPQQTYRINNGSYNTSSLRASSTEDAIRQFRDRMRNESNPSTYSLISADNQVVAQGGDATAAVPSDNQGNWGVWVPSLDRWATVGNAGPRRFRDQAGAERWIRDYNATPAGNDIDLVAQEIDPVAPAVNRNTLMPTGPGPWEVFRRSDGSSVAELGTTNRMAAEVEARGVIDQRREAPELYGVRTQQQADAAQGGIIDIEPDVAQNFAPQTLTRPGQGQQTFTGNWLILDPDGQEIHRFSGVGNVQSDANRVAINWMRSNPGRMQAGVTVVPEMGVAASQQRYPYTSTPIPGVEEVELDIPLAQTQWEVYNRSSNQPVFVIQAANQTEAWRKGQEWVAAAMQANPEVDASNFSVRSRSQSVSENITVLEQRLRQELDTLGNQTPTGPETPPKMPAGTIKVDVSDMYDWYKLGQHISNLKGIDKSTLGKGPPHTVFAFGSEELENKYSHELTNLGLKTHDLDEPGEEDMDESREITKLGKLDNVLEKCINMIHRGHETDPEKYGRVAACLIDNKNNHTYAINLPGLDGTRRHAERVAIDKHLKRHGRIGPNAIMVTTLSPCVDHMDERYGESCTDLLADFGIEKCYAGWQDPTQHPTTDYPFNLQVTDNADIFNSCRDIAASFLPGAMVEGLDEAVTDNYLYHATQPGGMMRILRSGEIKASYRPQEATKAKTQYPTVSTTRSKQYAESDDFVDFLHLTNEGNSVIIIFDKSKIANHYKMFSTSQGTQTVGDEFEEVIIVPKGSMPIQGTMKGFYFNPNRKAEIEGFKDLPWFKELLNSPYYIGQKQGVANDAEQERPEMRFKEFQLTENSKVTIKRVQQMLLDLGYELGPTGVDGIVGPYTQSAIDAYMSKVGPQGQVTPKKAGPQVPVTPKKAEPSTSSTMPVNGRLTSAFGNRRAPVPGATTNHPGVDIAVPTGTPVRSPIAGKVVYASMDNNACGGTIAISNGEQKHRFCHCSKIDVRVGQVIQQGDVVGLTGGGARDPGRGLSTGPHLHWEKYIAGNLVDPMSNIG